MRPPLLPNRSAARRACCRACRSALAFFCFLALVCAADPGWAQPAATTIVVIGDSQAQGVAAGLGRLFLRDPQFRVLDKSKVATGITLKATFDWPSAAQRIAAASHADIAIVMFGANDRPPAHALSIDRVHAELFREVCDERARAIIRAFRQAGIEVIWLGHPIVREPPYSEDMAFLNQILANAARQEGAQWVPLWSIVAGGDGGYTAYGKAVDGETRRLRADDGVHFTAAGYDLIARYLAPALETRRPALAASPAAAR